MAKTLKELLEGIPEEQREDYLADPANRAAIAAAEKKPAKTDPSKDAVGNLLFNPAGSTEWYPQDWEPDYSSDPANLGGTKGTETTIGLAKTEPKTDTGAEQKAGGVTLVDRRTQESPEVAAARAALAKLTAPSAFSSEWSEQLRSAVDTIMGREKFSYDPYADVLYQNYKDSYMRQGKRAMEDTMGRAAAMTGGYGNSYAQAVGNAAYNEYVDKLNERVPELYNAALNRYNAEGSELYSRASLLANMENSDYQKYRDAMTDYLNERNFAYQQERDAISDARYDTEWAYQQERDAIADQRYDNERAYKQERDAISDQRYDAEWAYTKKRDAISDARYADELAYNREQNAKADDDARRDAAVKLGLPPGASWEDIAAETANNNAYKRELEEKKYAASGIDVSKTPEEIYADYKAAENAGTGNTAESKPTTYDVVSKAANDFDDIYMDDPANGQKAAAYIANLVRGGQLTMADAMTVFAKHDFITANTDAFLQMLESLYNSGDIGADIFDNIITTYGLESAYINMHGGAGGADVVIESDEEKERKKRARSSGGGGGTPNRYVNS